MKLRIYRWPIIFVERLEIVKVEEKRPWKYVKKSI